MEKFDVKKQEADDFKLLEKLNEDVFKLKNLSRRKGDSNPIDASGFSSNNNEVVNIEIKSRECKINTYPTLMMETHKGYTLLEEYIKYKRIPLYVNFLEDGNAVVFNLLHSNGYMKRGKADSRLYGDKESEYKYFLSLKNAWIYKKTNNTYKLIQKGLK